MNSWPSMSVADIADQVAMGPFGSNIKVDTFVLDPGVPVISGAHLKRSLVDLDGDFNFITQSHAESLSRSMVGPGDIVLTHAGTIGQVSCVPNGRFDRLILSQRQFYIRPNPSLVDPMFITHYLRSPAGQHLILANASQSGVPSIAQPVSYIKSVRVPVPPLEIQKSISGVLNALEEKIAKNERLMSVADELFQLHWEKFYSFGASWEQVSLHDVASPQYGLTASADRSAQGAYFLRVTDINKKNWVDWSSVPSVPKEQIDFEKFELALGDLLVARMGDP